MEPAQKRSIRTLGAGFFATDRNHVLLGLSLKFVARGLELFENCFPCPRGLKAQCASASTVAQSLWWTAIIVVALLGLSSKLVAMFS